MRWLLLAVATGAWSVLAWMFVFVFAGVHVCSILNPVGSATSQVAMSAEQAAAQMATNCDRPDIGAILVSGIGYLVLAGVAFRIVGVGRDVSPGSTR